MKTLAVIAMLLCTVVGAAAADTLPAQTKPAETAGYSGGDGTSMENAVVIQAANESAGVQAEYRWLDLHFPGYKNQDQSLLNGKGGKVYDVINFTMPDGSKHSVYFDISGYFGKY